MFKNKLKIRHIVNKVDNKIEEDYFSVEVYSPNGEYLKDKLKIRKIDAEDLIALLLDETNKKEE